MVSQPMPYRNEFLGGKRPKNGMPKDAFCSGQQTRVEMDHELYQFGPWIIINDSKVA